MEMIKLDITKAACFLEKGAVESFEPKVAVRHRRLLRPVLALATTSWVGCTCQRLSHLLLSMSCRLAPTLCALTARLS